MSHHGLVALVISNLEFGGAQRQVVELANGLYNAGVPVCLVSMSDCVPLQERLNQNIKLHVVQKKAKFDVTVISRLARLLKREQVRLVHGFLYDAEIAVRLAGRWARVPTVLGSERNSDYVIAPFKRRVYQLTRGMRDGCIANSWAGANFNSRTLLYPMTHYRVVYNGVDTERFQPRDINAAKQALKLDSKRHYIGMIGSFKKQKNHLQLVRCAAEVCAQFPDHDFIVAGDVLDEGRRASHDIKQEVVGEIERLGLTERVHLLGNIETIEVFYNACVATVLPSYYEGLPNVVLESFASGVPVVASDVSDNTLVVPKDGSSYVVQVDDDPAFVASLTALLQDDNTRARSDRLRALTLEQFSQQKFASNMLEAYQSFGL
ncbi:MAG: glycosyltransferase [Pseudomonadota bacterium]